MMTAKTKTMEDTVKVSKTTIIAELNRSKTTMRSRRRIPIQWKIVVPKVGKMGSDKSPNQGRRNFL